MASRAAHSRAPALAPLLAAIAATSLLCACSSAPKYDPAGIPALAGQEVPDLQMDELAAVSEEMVAFLEQHAPRTMNRRQRTFMLAYVMTDPFIMGFRYDPAITLPPDLTFERRTGNCLSFSLMLVSMARHVGIPAQFQEAELEPEYRSINDTFVNSRHVNVLIGEGNNTYLIDVSGRVPKDTVRTRRISDHEAWAQYYNNLGVEALLVDDLPTAWTRFRQALMTDAGLAYLWSNLGVVYNRNRQVEDAEHAYRIALSVDKRESIAANNLYVIYQQEGRFTEAADLERRVERHRKRNPYYLAKLATEALESRQYEEAIDLLQKSIEINGDEYRFHGAMAQAQYLAGNHEEALSSLDLARSLAPETAAGELETLPLRSVPQ